jgi:hypothetical protein
MQTMLEAHRVLARIDENDSAGFRAVVEGLESELGPPRSPSMPARRQSFSTLNWCELIAGTVGAQLLHCAPPSMSQRKFLVLFLLGVVGCKERMRVVVERAAPATCARSRER